MNVALLGLPQAGKKTLFTLLTNRHLPHGRKEGESIEGQAPVRDLRVARIAEICKPQRTKYAEVVYVLCPDVSTSAQREWTTAARKSDLLCMLVRKFTDASVYHPSGSVDAERDRRNLEAEVVLADLELVEKRLDRIRKEARAGQTPQQLLEQQALEKCKSALEAGSLRLEGGLEDRERACVASLGLLTLKPILWAYNVDEKDVSEGHDPFSIACKIEQEIMDLEDPVEREEYLRGLGLSSSGIDRMNAAAYDALGLMSFYTMGPDEVRAWTIRKGSLAPTAAGKIHTDIERGFIRVEVVRYEDLLALGSEAAVHTAGKAQVKGKDYVIQDGDICHFRFNV